MEDVKDTLWKWAVQIATLANWGWELRGVWLCAPMIREMLGLGPELIPQQAIWILIGLMMALASVFYWRLLSLRKWAGWTKVAASSAHVFRAVTASEIGLSHWSAQLALATAMVLMCALIFRPRVWQRGF